MTMRKCSECQDPLTRFAALRGKVAGDDEHAARYRRSGRERFTCGTRCRKIRSRRMADQRKAKRK